ncbi:hypothetical protein DSC45_34510 [Streptomyces sp. YIM 130001]|uniref:SgcJ/EcaC family oxidoreductase n=1 Tax=Streptomyces sp. YIM 130001 TaxID=2259644 RepID=UPI000E64E93E|nr:SgcJ/EcaC family oxidoreductase [Streptomyces sp. YIM 130001]RII07941.1 hypothetical protein DSC45_34510 [Streptomyces sp. YIM 130001]
MPATATRWGNATRILKAAGVEEDTSYYRTFDSENEKAVLSVALRIQAAWAGNDANAFADCFAANGSLLMRNDQLKSREEIRAYMAEGFRGIFQGAHVQGGPLSLRFLSDDVATVVTEGGIVLAGASGVAPDRRIRATWVIVRGEGGDGGDGPQLLSHQSSPIS